MKKNYFLSLLVSIIFSGLSFSQDLIITGIIDGPLPGGLPKGIELYAKNAIADLSIYGIESTTNGAAAAAVEYTFPADAISAGTFIYLSINGGSTGFLQYLGVTPQYENAVMNINGDDTVILYKNAVIEDSIGVIGEDGTGKDWDHLDGWAYRKDGNGPNAAFLSSEWTFSGANALDSCAGGTNAECSSVFPIGTYKSTAPTSPEISVGNAITGLNYFFGNGSSVEKDFSVSGINLTTDIIVTAPQDFEVSLTTGNGFGPSVSISPSSGTVASTTIYVRLKSGLAVNSYTGDATVTSTGATNKTVALSGQVSPADPQFYYTQFLNNFTYTAVSGGPSAEQNFKVNGLFLTADLIITAPVNYEVSLTTGVGFGNSVSITPNSGTVAETTIYIRLAASLSEGNYTGNIVISSTGVTNKTFAVNGSVFGSTTNSMVITGVFDGPLTGGTPKGVEIFVLKDIADLTKFGISAIANGGGSLNGTASFTFPAGSATAGSFIYIASDQPNFTAFFGFASTYTTGVVNVNGDDSFELIENGQIIDVFGNVALDGTGLPWEYLDGWAYRKSNTGPEGTIFTEANWTYSGINNLEGGTTNATVTTPFPIGTYTNNTASVKNNTIDGFATYPNPVTNQQFTITSKSTENKQVTIFNVLGKKVLATNFSGTKSDINVSNLSSGIYILKVSEGKKAATSKLVIR
jgi:hypothetical protein